MKKIMCAALLLCFFSLLNGQDNNITNKLGASGNFKVLKSDNSTELLKVAEATGLISGSKVAFTPEGGIAVRMINKTGTSVKGTIVTSYGSTVDNACVLSPIASTGGDRPFGVMYEADIPDGSLCWVVVAGIADVLLQTTLYSTTVSPGYVVMASSTVVGRADSYQDPTASTHDRECGHFLESKSSGNQLVKVALHFR
jgi:hypothetical protein